MPGLLTHERLAWQAEPSADTRILKVFPLFFCTCVLLYVRLQRPKADVAAIDKDGVKLYIGNLDFKVSCFAQRLTTLLQASQPSRKGRCVTLK